MTKTPAMARKLTLMARHVADRESGSVKLEMTPGGGGTGGVREGSNPDSGGDMANQSTKLLERCGPESGTNGARGGVGGPV